MADPEHGVLRTIRAGVLNSGVFLLAAGGHYLAGGDVPEPVVLALLAAFTQLACTLLVRRLSFFAVLAAMILGQFLLHHAFLAAHGAGSCVAGAGAGAGAPGHHHGATLAATCGPVAAHGGHETAPMVGAHAVATVLSAALLTCGDRALLALIRFVAPRLRTAYSAPVLARPAPRPRLTPVGRPCIAVPRVRLDSVSRRGPPAAASI